MIGEVAEQPAADRAHDEAEREEDGGVELLHDRIASRKEGAGEIQREGRVRVKVVPLHQIADRSDEDRLDAAPHIRHIEPIVRHDGDGRSVGHVCRCHMGWP